MNKNKILSKCLESFGINMLNNDKISIYAKKLCIFMLKKEGYSVEEIRNFLSLTRQCVNYHIRKFDKNNEIIKRGIKNYNFISKNYDE